MIIYHSFGFPTEEKLFDKVTYLLENKFGLVKGREEIPISGEKVLVWEDEKSIGRYRVHCHENRKTIIDKNLDVFTFHYWSNKVKFNRKIFSQEPMNLPLEEIKKLSKNRYDLSIKVKDLDELEKMILADNPFKNRNK